MEVLKDVGEAITTIPDDFKPHRQVKRVYDQRKAMITSGEGIDWGMAEALAFGTLLIEGVPHSRVRSRTASTARTAFICRPVCISLDIQGHCVSVRPCQLLL